MFAYLLAELIPVVKLPVQQKKNLTRRQVKLSLVRHVGSPLLPSGPCRRQSVPVFLLLRLSRAATILVYPKTLNP